MTRAHLSRWGACDDTCDAAALVVSELVTNAIVHTASRRIHCELNELRDSAGERVRIAVRDEGHVPGYVRPQSRVAPGEEYGRGLLLVAAVSSAWGAQEAGTGPGLLVWAELPRDGHQMTGPGAVPVPEPGDVAEWAW
ncbi:ATP-binding protein [Streptomyces beihaiensis]|uniref:ATP-binding protein n=1 Tax=Streptomyces beihaiensis TaxID=2984495 RepID=UPI002B1CCA37|nr:ATP-binding protein [Streptomyces beihaiensis]